MTVGTKQAFNHSSLDARFVVKPDLPASVISLSTAPYQRRWRGLSDIEKSVLKYSWKQPCLSGCLPRWWIRGPSCIRAGHLKGTLTEGGVSAPYLPLWGRHLPAPRPHSLPRRLLGSTDKLPRWARDRRPIFSSPWTSRNRWRRSGLSYYRLQT